MFAHLRDIGSTYGLAGFMVLALIVGPVVEEVIFGDICNQHWRARCRDIVSATNISGR